MVLFARLIRHKPNSTAIEDQYHIPDAPCMDYLPPSGENGTQFKGKCREIFPTWSIWVSIDSYANCVLCPHELSANHSDIFRAFHLTPFCAVETLRFVGRIFSVSKPVCWWFHHHHHIPLGGFHLAKAFHGFLRIRSPDIAEKHLVFLGSDGWIWEGLKNAWIDGYFLTATKHHQKHTHTWWSWVLFLRDDFCEGNVKIRQIRCTSETEAPPTFKAPFLGDEGD